MERIQFSAAMVEALRIQMVALKVAWGLSASQAAREWDAVPVSKRQK